MPLQLRNVKSVSLENEFHNVLSTYKRKWYIEKSTDELLINILLIGLLGSTGIGIVLWRLTRK